MKGVWTFKNGVKIINCTPHPIKFRDVDGAVIEVEPSGYHINASAQEQVVEEHPSYKVVKTVFVPTEEGRREIQEIKQKYGDDIIIIGSAISAQAYSPEVKAMVLENPRVPVDKKIARIDKFSVF